MKKLPPAAILTFMAKESLRVLVFGILFGAYYLTEKGESVSQLQGFGIIFLLVLLVALLAAVIQYITFRYEVAHDVVNIESGLISKSFKTIPFSKVQDVKITQGIVERILNLSTLGLDTAGSGRMEGKILGISLTEANLIKDNILKK